MSEEEYSAEVSPIKETSSDVTPMGEVTSTSQQSTPTSTKEHQMNPLDKFYQFLRIKITTLDDTSKTFSLIDRAIQNTHGPTHDKYTLKIQNVFEVERNGSRQRFLPLKQLPNRMFLWF